MRYSMLYRCAKHVEYVMNSNSKLHYHNFQHVELMLDYLAESPFRDYERHQLFLACLFHDIVYDPLAKDNEEKSCEYMKQHISKISKDYDENPDSWTIRMTDQYDYVDKACKLIMATKHDGRADGDLEKYMCNLDLLILTQSQKIYEKYSEGVEKEYRYYISEKEYLEGRIKFISSMAERDFIFYEIGQCHNGYEEDCAGVNLYRERDELWKRLRKYQ